MNNTNWERTFYILWASSIRPYKRCFADGIDLVFDCNNGPVTALMQERIAADYLGRVFGLYGSAASLAMPVGLIISVFFC